MHLPAPHKEATMKYYIVNGIVYTDRKKAIEAKQGSK